MKNCTNTDMVWYDKPLIFWWYLLERQAIIENYFSKINYVLDGKVPHSMMTGKICDIYTLCNIDWYEWEKYRKTGECLPHPTYNLGRCLESAINNGNDMSMNLFNRRGGVGGDTHKKLLSLKSA